MRLLRMGAVEGDYRDVAAYLRTLPPSAVDAELHGMQVCPKDKYYLTAAIGKVCAYCGLSSVRLAKRPKPLLCTCIL